MRIVEKKPNSAMTKASQPPTTTPIVIDAKIPSRLSHTLAGINCMTIALPKPKMETAVTKMTKKLAINLYRF
ncbi:MAG: hypothetical protein ACK2UF_06105 [Candidatus Promineifilaceae bacterium]